MSGLLRRLGALAARRARWVVAAWIVIAVGMVLLANSAGRPTNNDLTLPGTGSTEATDLLEERLPAQANGSVPIVIEAPGGTLASGANKTAVERTVASLEQNQYVGGAVSPYSPEGAGSITEDGRIAYISVALTISSGALDESEAESVLDSADPARKAGLEVSAGGYLGQELSTPSTRLSEIIGVVGALIVLLVAFRSFAAAPLPVTTAVLALLTGLAIVGLAGHAIDVPTIAPTLGIMLGLAVGVDYSLFIISRHLRLLDQGLEPLESISRSVGSSGSAVVFAGTTVILALLSLYFSGIPLVRSLGYTTAIVVATAVVAAITLLPALLGLLGRRIKSLPVPLPRRRHNEGHSGGWARWATGLRDHPVIASVSGIVVLIVLAIPTLDLRLGAPDFGQLPTDTTERQAYDALTEGFGVGTNGPLLVAVEIGGTSAASAEDPRLVKLEQEIAKQGDVQSVSPAQVDPTGNAAVLAVTPKTSPSAYATEDLVNHLRDETIPDATQGTALTAYVGGTTAGYIDLADKISEKLVLVIAIVVALSVLLLTLAFRTLVIPLTSAVLNLLAVVAAYGILTAVFEKGWGIELIGLEDKMPVVSYVPLMMFAILFGLSMDYQVFLVSRIAERHGGGAANSEAVRAGVVNAGHVIAAAATIMFAVFFSFVINGDPIVKQFGVGLAVAVAIDAFVVLLIVPAVMELLRERNWYLPGWLDRLLPDLKVEGDVDLRSETRPD